jgi:hypothetical protein
MGDRRKEKVALVSERDRRGPGWGNGRAPAVLFAREGAKVLAAGVNLDAAIGLNGCAIGRRWRVAGSRAYRVSV